jgi:N6-adenosine-specific RNA methylase IME4
VTSLDDVGMGLLKKGRYRAIVADPPWRFASNSKERPGRNAASHYDCMKPSDIAGLPIAELSADNCALFLWITGPHLAIASHLPIMKAWGFKPSGVAFTWIKLRPKASAVMFEEADLAVGTGFTTRKNAEFCLMGKKGRSVRASTNVREVIVSPRRQHSRKPDEFYSRVRTYVGDDAPICELFSRQKREGIDAWGDQVDLFNGSSP